MDDELGVYIIALVVAAIISWAMGEFFGRGKHIGRDWTFALSITTAFIGGIIALLASPSAKGEPTKGGQGYVIGGWVCFIFGVLNIIMLNPFAIGFFVTAAYLRELSNGKVINTNPKFYFNKNSLKSLRINNAEATSQKNKNNFDKEEISYEMRIHNLINLKNKGLLTETEYQEKKIHILRAQQDKDVIQSEEYKQLYDLLGAELLTQEEFDIKVEALKKMKKSSIEFEDEINYSEESEIDSIQEKDLKSSFSKSSSSQTNTKSEVEFADFKTIIYRLSVFGFIILYPICLVFLSENDIIDFHPWWGGLVFFYWLIGITMQFQLLYKKRLVPYLLLLSILLLLISIDWKIGQWM